MAGITYDTGALLAAERGNRTLWALHRRALERGIRPTVPAGVLAQAWRGGPQAELSRFLAGCRVEALTEAASRVTGAACARFEEARRRGRFGRDRRPGARGCRFHQRPRSPCGHRRRAREEPVRAPGVTWFVGDHPVRPNCREPRRSSLPPGRPGAEHRPQTGASVAFTPRQRRTPSHPYRRGTGTGRHTPRSGSRCRAPRRQECSL